MPWSDKTWRQRTEESKDRPIEENKYGRKQKETQRGVSQLSGALTIQAAHSLKILLPEYAKHTPGLRCFRTNISNHKVAIFLAQPDDSSTFMFQFIAPKMHSSQLFQWFPYHLPAFLLNFLRLDHEARLVSRRLIPRTLELILGGQASIHPVLLGSAGSSLHKAF